jgi:hypothetical protein
LLVSNQQLLIKRTILGKRQKNTPENVNNYPILKKQNNIHLSWGGE